MNDSTTNLPSVINTPHGPGDVSATGANSDDATKRNDLQHSANSLVDPAVGSDAKSSDLEHVHVPYSEYLCERQQLAIRLLIAGEREGEVAKKVGISRTTLWRWRGDIHFRSALAAYRDLAFGAAVDRLRGLVPQAVDCVQQQLEKGDTLAPFRLLRLTRAENAPQLPTIQSNSSKPRYEDQPDQPQDGPLFVAHEATAAIAFTTFDGGEGAAHLEGFPT